MITIKQKDIGNVQKVKRNKYKHPTTESTKLQSKRIRKEETGNKYNMSKKQF